MKKYKCNICDDISPCEFIINGEVGKIRVERCPVRSLRDVSAWVEVVDEKV